MRKLLSGIFFLLFVVTVFTFIGGLASTFINPKYFWPIAFLGLGFPVTFLVLCGFLLYWLFSKNKKVIYPLILLLVLFFLSPGFFSFKISPSKSSDEDALKVMTYNVRNFEVYDKENSKEKRDAIIALIKEQDVDILCLQEAIDRKGHIQLQEMAKQTGLPNYYMEVGTIAKDNAKFGVAIFSKHNILEKTSYPFGSGGNVGTKIDIEREHDTISVFNIHLESANIERSFYNYSSDELDSLSKKAFIARARIVSQQLKNAFKSRSTQANLIREEIKQSEHPVIVCGDFNDTPISYSYSRVRGKLKDTFRKNPIGFGGTYPDLPLLRIDHILVSQEFDVINYKIIKEEISDHFPVVTELKLKETSEE